MNPSDKTETPQRTDLGFKEEEKVCDGLGVWGC